MYKKITVVYFLLMMLLTSIGVHADNEFQIVERGFLYDGQMPPTCHAVTMVEANNGDIIAAFFGGTHEGHPDSDIWICRFNRTNSTWSAPEILADGVMTKYTRSAFDYDPMMKNIMHRDSLFEKTTWLKPAKNNAKALYNNKVRKPCYNPVLYIAHNGNIVLDYKIGSNMQDWTGWEIVSKNDGRTWSHPRPLCTDSTKRHLVLGPIKDKPIVNNGRIIAGSSTEVTYNSWCVHFETSDDGGRTWDWRDVKCDTILCIQPTILNLGNNHLKALCRTRQHKISVTESFDNGTTWTDMKLTDAPNNNSGIDAVTLNDGRHLLICNYHGTHHRRSPLTLLISNDGDNWSKVVDIEKDDGMEYSYPAIIQSKDGDIWILYTWHRKKIAYVHLKAL